MSVIQINLAVFMSGVFQCLESVHAPQRTKENTELHDEGFKQNRYRMKELNREIIT